MVAATVASSPRAVRVVAVSGTEDFAAQAVVAKRLLDAVPDIPLIGEEEEAPAPISEDHVRRLHGRAEKEIRQALQPYGYYSPTIRTRLDRIEGDGRVTEHVGGYSDWVARGGRLAALETGAGKRPASSVPPCPRRASRRARARSCGQFGRP